MVVAQANVSIQPVISRMGNLWYYEWFSGVGGTDWLDREQAWAADNHTLETLLALHGRGPIGPIGVNLSFLSAAEHGADFIRQLAALVPPGTVVEVTEHGGEKASGMELAGFERCCRAIHEAGFLLALDDCAERHPFGSPSLWGRINPHIIKVDITEPSHERVATAARNDGRLTIHERVETRQQQLQAMLSGCNGLQGFIVGRPVPLSTSINEASSV